MVFPHDLQGEERPDFITVLNLNAIRFILLVFVVRGKNAYPTGWPTGQ